MNIKRVQLGSLANYFVSDIDLFICSASYEMRCRSVADRLPRAKVRRALIAETEHRHRYFSENGEYLRSLFASHIPATLDGADPVATADALWTGLREGIPT